MKSNNIFFSIIIPILLGVGLLYLYAFNSRKASEIGLGEGTSTYTPSIDNFPIHITTLQLADSLKKGWISRGSKDVYLWQGNSQLHGVNQYKDGQVNCIKFLFDTLKTNNKEVIGASYPNGNLQEFLVSLLYMSKLFPLKLVIQPVFYDDMREEGIRNEINIPNIGETIYNDSMYFSDLSNVKKITIKDTGKTISKNNDFKGLQETAQDRSERYVDSKLENSWSIWKSRPDIRGNLFNDIYKLRNLVLGIKANTVRKMIPNRFKENYYSLLQMMKYCNDKHLPILVYIPPLRNDVSPPYDIEEYHKFIADVENDCKKNNAVFLNLGNLVPAFLWGVKEGTSFGTAKELDFMHFQQTGHKLIADTIYKTTIKIGTK